MSIKEFADKLPEDHFIWEDDIEGIDKPVIWKYKDRYKGFYEWPIWKRSDYEILVQLTREDKKIALDYLDELHEPINEQTRQHNNEKARQRRANR